MVNNQVTGSSFGYGASSVPVFGSTSFIKSHGPFIDLPTLYSFQFRNLIESDEFSTLIESNEGRVS